MANRQERGRTRKGAANGAAQPRNVEEARHELAATRRRISQDLDVIEARLRGAAGDFRQRLDVLEPARARIRAQVWASLALAFGAGLAYALLTAPRSDGRRRPLGRMLHSTARRLPGAVFAGMRAGVADRLQQEWRGTGALPGPRTREEIHPSS